MISSDKLQDIAGSWETAAQECRDISDKQHRNPQLRAVLETRAKELETCAGVLRELAQGPVVADCRCGMEIIQTKAGTWKHIQPIPIRMTGHVARPATKPLRKLKEAN